MPSIHNLGSVRRARAPARARARATARPTATPRLQAPEFRRAGASADARMRLPAPAASAFVLQDFPNLSVKTQAGDFSVYECVRGL